MGAGGQMLMTIHAHIYNKKFSESSGEVKYNNRIHLSWLLGAAITTAAQ